MNASPVPSGRAATGDDASRDATRLSPPPSPPAAALGDAGSVTPDPELDPKSEDTPNMLVTLDTADPTASSPCGAML